MLHHFATQVLYRILAGEEQIFPACFCIKNKSNIHNRLTASQLGIHLDLLISSYSYSYVGLPYLVRKENKETFCSRLTPLWG